MLLKPNWVLDIFASCSVSEQWDIIVIVTWFVDADLGVAVEVVILTTQEMNLPSLAVYLVMTVWFSMISHMLCALLFVPTILVHQPVWQYVTFVLTL